MAIPRVAFRRPISSLSGDTQTNGVGANVSCLELLVLGRAEDYHTFQSGQVEALSILA